MKLKHAVFISILIITYFFWSYFVLKNDEIPPIHDGNVCYSLSIYFYKNFLENFRIIFSNINFYPPLYMLLPSIFFKIFGIDPDVVSLTNIIYFSILLFSLYKISEILNNSGLFSVIVILTFHTIIGYYRITHLVTAITAILCLWIYFLIKTEYFTNRKYVLLSGATLGIGMLEGFHFAWYIIGPLIIYGTVSLLSKKNTRNKIENLVLFALFSLFITCLWYVPAFFIGNLKNIFSIQFTTHQAAVGYNISYFERFMEYIFSIPKMILIPNYIIFLFGLIVFLKKFKKNHHLKTIILGWFFIPLLTTSYIFPPVPRYILPILPSTSILIAFTLKEIFKNVKKIYNYILISFYFLALFFSFKFQYQVPQNSYELLDSRLDYGILYSYKYDPKVSALIKFLEEKEGNHEFTMVIITEDSLNPAAFCIELLYDKFRFTDLRIKYYTAMSLCLFRNRENNIKKIFNKAKYILYIKNKISRNTIRPDYDPDVNKQLKYFFASCTKKLVGVFKDPKGFFVDEFYLYEKLD